MLASYIFPHYIFYKGTGKIIWANETELKLLGYTADEYIGHSIMEVTAQIVNHCFVYNIYYYFFIYIV